MYKINIVWNFNLLIIKQGIVYHNTWKPVQCSDRLDYDLSVLF